MQNMQVILYPKQIHISSTTSKSVRLTYKKMAITTNHELQKYQNREFYPVNNSVAVINDQVKFKLSKQFEFQNTKIVIILIGTKGRQVSCLGDVTLDLASIKQKKIKDHELYKAHIDKCKDSKAFLIFDIRFIEKPVDLNEIKRNKKQKIPELGVLKTDHYYKEQLYISRREKTDKPTAYEISRKNYKNNQILRNQSKSMNKDSRENRDSKDSAKENTNNGSYKKRFLYEVQRNDKSSQKSSSKSIRNNYLSVYQKDKSPSPRIKTPQPITLDTLKSRETHNRIKSKVQPLNLSDFDTKKVNFDDSDQLMDPDTFRAHGVTNVRRPINQEKRRMNKHDLSDSNISQHSLQSIKNQKDSKYKMITDKLELIESKIRQRSKSKDQHDDTQNEGNQKSQNHKVAKSEIDEVDSYSIVNEYHVSRTLTVVSNPNDSRRDGGQHNKANHSKHARSPISPTQSICPQNQQAPSPIHVVQTPTVNKSSLDQIKMSEFTINSKKSETSEAELPKTHKMSSECLKSNPEPSPVNPKSFNEINLKGPNDDHAQGNPSISSQPVYQPGFTIRKDSKSPQSNGKREISPSSLSFERRESELKLQKKGSSGQNYLEIQVKMLELQAQEKDMKLQKLQKKLSKKQEESSSLSRDIEDAHQKIATLQNQLIELKAKNLDIQKNIEGSDQILRKLNEKGKQLETKQLEIRKLHEEIANVSSGKQKEECKECRRAKFEVESVQKNNQQQIKRLQQSVNIKDQLAVDLKQQLQTYQQEVSTLRSRLSESQNFKSKYEQLLQIHQSGLSAIAKLQQKIEFYQAQKQTQKQTYNNTSHSESMADSKASKASHSNQVAQQVLRQTIQKQNILQQSLKSLENRNKSLAQQVQALQKEKEQLIQKTSQINQQNQLSSQSQAKISQLKASIDMSQAKIQAMNLERESVLEQMKKKDKKIQKLSAVNESLNTTVFELQNQQHKLQQMDESTQHLLIKNAQNEQTINELNERLNNKEKQMKILKNLLRQRQNESSKISNQNNKEQMKRQLPDQSNLPSKSSSWKGSIDQSISKSEELARIKVTEEGKQNFYEQYLNEKAKSVNLQAQLRYAQNQIRNHKIRIQLLSQQKNALEQQIQKTAFGTPKDKAKTKPQQKYAPDNLENTRQTVPQSIKQTAEPTKFDNKQVQEEIQRLQSQVRQLNSLLDSIIQKGTNLQQSQISYPQSQLTVQNGITAEKYWNMVRRLEAYETELRSKKNKMAEIVNSIWRGGNAGLIDQIDRIMNVQ